MRSKHIVIFVFLLLVATIAANADTSYMHVASFDLQTAGTFYTYGTPDSVNFDVGICPGAFPCGYPEIFINTSFGDHEEFTLPSGFQTFGFDASKMRDESNNTFLNLHKGQIMGFGWGPTNVVHGACGTFEGCLAEGFRGTTFCCTYLVNWDYIVVTVGPITTPVYVGHQLVYDGVPELGAPLVDADIYQFSSFAVHIDAYQAVPEPGTLLLLPSGLITALGLRRTLHRSS